MSEAAASAWAPRSAWSGHARTGRHGRQPGEPGVRLWLRDGIGLATIIVADGQADTLGARIAEQHRWKLPGPGTTDISGGSGLIWSAPGQWLAVAETRDVLRELPELLRGVASVTDQSDGRAVVRVTGPQARTALEKGVAVDLHPRAFRAGCTAVTSVAHIGAQLWQLDDLPTYDIAVARSFAGSFWSWLTDAVAEFGYEVSDAPLR